MHWIRATFVAAALLYGTVQTAIEPCQDPAVSSLPFWYVCKAVVHTLSV